jgi:hypothetical protein
MDSPRSLKHEANRLALKYYLRLKKRARHPSRDSQQFPLSGEDSDDGGFAEFRQVDCSAVADPGRAFRRSNDRWKFRKHQAGMEK